MAVRPAKTDQLGHRPSLIRVVAVRIKKPWILSYPMRVLRRLWSDCADAQADLCLRWAHSHFVDFVMSRLILSSGRTVAGLDVRAGLHLEYRSWCLESEKKNCLLFCFQNIAVYSFSIDFQHGKCIQTSYFIASLKCIYIYIFIYLYIYIYIKYKNCGR